MGWYWVSHNEHVNIESLGSCWAQWTHWPSPDELWVARVDWSLADDEDLNRPRIDISFMIDSMKIIQNKVEIYLFKSVYSFSISWFSASSISTFLLRKSSVKFTLKYYIIFHYENGTSCYKRTSNMAHSASLTMLFINYVGILLKQF